MSISSSAVGIGYLVGERGAGFDRAEAYRLRAAQTRRPAWTMTDRSMRRRFLMDQGNALITTVPCAPQGERRTLRSSAFVKVPNR
jgi:hypothetical protein